MSEPKHQSRDRLQLKIIHNMLTSVKRDILPEVEPATSSLCVPSASLNNANVLPEDMQKFGIDSYFFSQCGQYMLSAFKVHHSVYTSA